MLLLQNNKNCDSKGINFELKMLHVTTTYRYIAVKVVELTQCNITITTLAQKHLVYAMILFMDL